MWPVANSGRVTTPRRPARPWASSTGTGIAVLREELQALRADLVASEKQDVSKLRGLEAARRESARNLIHYVAIRRKDIRHLQEQLAALGLSSLGRAESNVLFVIDAVLGLLDRLEGKRGRPLDGSVARFNAGRRILEANTDALLGQRRPGRDVRIMVTMPSEAAHDYALVRDLVACGMDTMRINCAHDAPAEWSAMIRNLRRAERETGRKCPVMMDLGGPKLRTGAIEYGAAVADWRPHRDRLGRIQAPARIWLTPDLAAHPAPLPADASLPLPADWIDDLSLKDTVRFVDARGGARTLKVVGEHGEGKWAEGTRAAYVVPGTTLHVVRTGAEASVGALPPADQTISVKRGDVLVLTRESVPGSPARCDTAGRVLTPASIPCTLPEAFRVVRPGERIWFDDGKVGGVIRKVGADQLHVEITQARLKGGTLRSDKGINLPDSTLALPSLTEKDLADLPFVARHADVVGLSFVRRPEDVEELARRLAGLGAPGIGVVLKIESRQAFEALPDLLLVALRLPRTGIMIARGDLLVECGYERLAEIQEEILWLCEAAHLPVVWATQVLESLAQKGIPSRAEITDAAMGARAECVMLNKGPHILDAIEILDSILRRMQSHQAKKTSRLRRLHF